MSEGPAEESSELFKSVLSGFTEEQWEYYRLQKKLEGGLVVDEDDDVDVELDYDIENSFCLESRSSSPNNFEEFSTNFDVVEKDDSESAAESDEDGDVDLQWNSDVAIKYVKGEIDFNVLAQFVEKKARHSKRKRGDVTESDEEDEEYKPETKVKRRRRRNYELPKELLGLMGAANVSYANRDHDDAIKKCIEIINIAPTAQEPYQTLGMVYDEMGESQKSLQCALVAAYLNPSDTNEWIRLANISIEESQPQQAIKCFSCAIRNDVKNIDLLWQRCNLYEQVGERKNALAGYKLILQNLNSPEDGPKCIELARGIAKVHHLYEDSVNAVKVLESAFSKFPALVTSEDVNMLLEHLMSKKMYQMALKNLVLHCGVTLELEKCKINNLNIDDFENLESDDLKNVLKCKFYNDLHVDLMAKLLVCLIYVKALNAIDGLLESLKKESPEDMGDLYFDVAEALMDVEEYSTAKPLLCTLVNSHKYNVAGVWLKHAECLSMLSENIEATDAYERVLRLAPSYQEARLPLSKLLANSGNKKAAADALKQEYENGITDSIVDLNVLVQRAEILYELGCYEEFITAANLTLLSHCLPVKTDEEILQVINNQSYKRRRETLKELPSITNRLAPSFASHDEPAETLWNIFYKLAKKLFEFQRFDALQSSALISMTSDVWRKSDKMSKDADCIGLLACYFNDSHKFGFVLIKDQIMKNLKHNRYFNLLALNTLKTLTIRHNRFCLRLMAKHTEHFALGVFNGHNAMVFGSYKLALGEYMNLLKKVPEDPEMNFYVGINYFHLASQKFATKRHFLIAQGLAFLQKYAQLRKNSQESYYNIGRGLHQLGIKDAAIQYYKMALATPPIITETDDKETFDLVPEIAYNMALIYQSSNEKLASMYLRTYNVV